MNPTLRRHFLFAVAVFIVLLGVSLSLQWSSGAYTSEFGGHPDEAAHYVTGLMVHDYLKDGLGQHPVRFAENYYEHYPKVAIGHYPPVFYALEGFWMTVFSPSHRSVYFFLALQSALLGMLVSVFLFPGSGWWASLYGGLIVVGLPLVQGVVSVLMSDIALAIFCLLSAVWFARFLESEKLRDSLLFGFLATAAILTKGSGLVLALVPAASILVMGRFHVLAKWQLYMGAVPVVLFAAPWMFYSRGITEEGMIDRTPLEHLGLAVPYFARQFFLRFGVVLLLPALIGLGWVFLRKRGDPSWVVIAVFPACFIAFYSLVPAGLEPRYLVLVAPFVAMLTVAGIRCCGRYSILAAGFVGVGLLLTNPRVSQKEFFGFGKVAQVVLDAPAAEVLISSDARGEGAFIAEVAMGDTQRPSRTVRRASKMLASSDWLGRGYETKFSNAVTLAEYLAFSEIGWVVIDRAVPEVFRVQHHRLLEEAAVKREGRFEFYDRYPYRRPRGGGGVIEVYRKVGSGG